MEISSAMNKFFMGGKVKGISRQNPTILEMTRG
jgi:hypothetical protein